MRATSWADAAYATAMGLLFAVLQTGYFFQLQFRLTAAYPSFLAITLAWLIGSTAGLWLSGKGSGAGTGKARWIWLAGGLLSYYCVLVLVRVFPYRIGWLPALGLLIAVSGIQAGHFFGVNRSLFASVSSLFFWENNGFILGWIAGFAGYVRFGSTFHWAAPVLAGLLAGALERRITPGAQVIGRLAQEGRNRLLLWLAGFSLILLNYTLIREMTLAFRDLETSALLMALAYFMGISLGYLVSDRIGASSIVRLLPLYLVAQMALISFGPLLVMRITDAAGTLVAYSVIVALVTLGSTSLYSIFLPNAIQSEEDSTKRYYSLEILGSLCGLVSLPFLGRGGMVLFYAAYFTSFVAIAALLRLRPVLLVILATLSVLFLMSFDTIDKRTSAAFYKIFYDQSGVERVVFTRYTPYHKIEVLETDRGDKLLMLNAHRQFGPSSHYTYSYFVAEYPARLLNRPKVCLVGCGSMSTVGRIGDLVDSIRIVDLDRGVFETSKEFFPEFNRLSELHNWTFQSDDAKHFLATSKEQFDLIIDDIPPAKTRQVALTYTKEFFELVRSRLGPGGIFSLPSLTPISSKREYGRRMLATLSSVFDQVLVLNLGRDSYYFATDKTRVFDRDAVYAAIDHPDKEEVTILLPEEVRERMMGVQTISINNMADLILY